MRRRHTRPTSRFRAPAAVLVLALTGCGTIGATDSGAAEPEPTEPEPAEQLRLSVATLENPRAPERIRAVRRLRALADGARPALVALVRAVDDADPAVRRQVRETLDDLQGALVRMACRHEDADVRAAAVPWIHAPARLMDVAKQAPPVTARVAIQQIEAPELLVNLALDGPLEVRTVAVQRLNDLPGLARVAHLGEPRVAAVARARVIARLSDVTDPRQLWQLAAGGHPELSAAAVAQLGALTRDSLPKRRAAALSRLIVLAQSVSAEQRSAIVKHFGDRPQLLALAGSGSTDIARALVELMPEDLEVLAALATHSNATIARMALKRSQHATVLAAAATHSDPDVRIAALSRMQDTKQMSQALSREPSLRVALVVVTGLTDRRALRRIGRTDRRPVVARLAGLLARQNHRSRKPLVAMHLRSDPRVRTLVRNSTKRLLGGRVLLFTCADYEECSHFDVQLWVEASVEMSNQCYDRYYYGGLCSSRGNKVVVEYAFHRDGKVIADQTFETRTPRVVRGRGYFSTNPTEAEVWRATRKELRQDARDWTLNIDFMALIHSPRAAVDQTPSPATIWRTRSPRTHRLPPRRRGR